MGVSALALPVMPAITADVARKMAMRNILARAVRLARLVSRDFGSASFFGAISRLC